MKYYVIEIATGDSKIAGKSVYEYNQDNSQDPKKKALASFHKKVGTSMDSDLYKTDLLLVIDEKGIVIERNYYEA